MKICAFIIVFSLIDALQAQKIVKFGKNNRFSKVNKVEKNQKFLRCIG